MKKNLLFAVPMVAIAILLFMLRSTGLHVHIAVSVAGLVILVVYAFATKKAWKCPALEIITRICYAIALITGVVIMNVSGVAVLAIVHKISAAFFAILFVATEIHKLIKK